MIDCWNWKKESRLRVLLLHFLIDCNWMKLYIHIYYCSLRNWVKVLYQFSFCAMDIRYETTSIKKRTCTSVSPSARHIWHWRNKIAGGILVSLARSFGESFLFFPFCLADWQMNMNETNWWCMLRRFTSEETIAWGI